MKIRLFTGGEPTPASFKVAMEELFTSASPNGRAPVPIATVEKLKRLIANTPEADQWITENKAGVGNRVAEALDHMIQYSPLQSGDEKHFKTAALWLRELDQQRFATLMDRTENNEVAHALLDVSREASKREKPAKAAPVTRESNQGSSWSQTIVGAGMEPTPRR